MAGSKAGHDTMGTPACYFTPMRIPLINQSAPLRPPRNRCEIESGEQGIGAMRAIMQGLTDAEFEQLNGTEEQCLATWVKNRREAGMACLRCGNPKSSVYDRRVGCTRCDMR